MGKLLCGFGLMLLGLVLIGTATALGSDPFVWAGLLCVALGFPLTLAGLFVMV
jgi:hypothetical protein